MKKPLIVGLRAPHPFGSQPYSFWDAPPKETAGGCGPGEGLGDRLVPDHLVGLSIKPACAIHDFMYLYGGRNDADKKLADKVFRQNMKRIVDAAGGWLKRPRRTLAYLYYLAVAFGGETAYWNAKYQDDLHEVVIT
jgi:hypothetical protein